MDQNGLLLDFGDAQSSSQPQSAQPPAAAPTAAAPATENTTQPEPKAPENAPELKVTDNEEKKVETQNASSPEEEKPAEGAKKEPENPVLKEILEKFGGKWKLVRSDPYDEYLKSIGVGLFNRQLASRSTPEQDVSVSNGKIFISFHSTFHNQNYVFELDQTVENLVQKVRQSVFCSYSNGTLRLQMTPVEEGWGKTQEVERSLNEMGEMVVIYTAGEAVCRRYFAKLPEIVIQAP